ncbi:thioredoxin family protein [Rubrimonas cliftonensis]|uniref:AhpC/TSA family protein n=1 Tax=Rubrimonas cliftonensis TaxID=89524 RepID=A0A1H3XMH6_9RHOB|nr:thioredoxin family protein [Rubrimonas cliftonensis]SEA00546.1 AhpC/TSA family protein [Rubrimonas cliftonensis]
MAEAPVCDFGWKAPAFTLPGVDGRDHALADVKGPNGVLVAFICNHCPYVKAIADRLARDSSDLAGLGVSTVAICANDATTHPEDSFDNMKRFAEAHCFGFPYLHDESQQVAKAWGAVCTPDFFGLNAALELQYRGRLDSSGSRAASPDARRELFEAMRQVAETGAGPRDQTPAIGCSIKWKAA